MDQEAVKLGMQLSAILIVIFVAAAMFWVKAFSYGIKAYSMIIPEKKMMIYINPFFFFMSKYFTDKGNVNRKLMLKNIGFFAISGCVFALITFVDSQ